MGSIIKTDIVPDFLFMPPNKSKSGKLELLFPNTVGYGLVRVVEQAENKFIKDKAGKINGVYLIQKEKCEDYIIIGKKGNDAVSSSDHR